jgi:hypothetical protein
MQRIHCDRLFDYSHILEQKLDHCIGRMDLPNSHQRRAVLFGQGYLTQKTEVQKRKEIFSRFSKDTLFEHYKLQE